MSYLSFDKNQLINLSQSLNVELLRTSRTGAYSCTTVSGCNTRKYHGLLVSPIPGSSENHVLLSSLDETIIQRGAEFNLGIHKFPGDHYYPKGHKYIRSFEADPIPKTTYRVGGVVLEREKIFVSNEDLVLLRYTLVDATSPTTLRLRPMLAFREVHALTRANMEVNQDYDEVENGISSCLYKGYPKLFMQLSKSNEFLAVPDWYHNVEYLKEQQRGYDFQEDLYTPGFFEVDIKKGESIIFVAGTKSSNTKTLKRKFTSETKNRPPRDSFENCLKNAAQQYFYINGKNWDIVSSYPWGKPSARDMVIAWPGLSLCIDELSHFTHIEETILNYIKTYKKTGNIDSVLQGMTAPDVPLWIIRGFQRFSIFVSKEKAAKKYLSYIKFIINEYVSNQTPEAKIHDNGLIWIDGKERPLTWMNAIANGLPANPRTGYVVEINALWYNALRFCLEMMTAAGDSKGKEEIQALCDKVAVSFYDTFWCEKGYLYDYVDGDFKDDSVRPNMVIAAGLPYSPLKKGKIKSILDVTERELLTPRGLRSLSPKNPQYHGLFIGPQNEREYAYHNGTVWPWLLGFFTEAYLKVYKKSGINRIQNILEGFDEEMTNHCIGTISEVYDGSPPHQGRGAISHAINVAELLRAIKIIETYDA